MSVAGFESLIPKLDHPAISVPGVRAHDTLFRIAIQSPLWRHPLLQDYRSQSSSAGYFRGYP